MGLLLPLLGSVYKQHTTMAAVRGGTKLRSQVRQQSREMGLGSNPFTIHPQGVNDLLKGPTSERLHCFPQSHSGSKSSAMSKQGLFKSHLSGKSSGECLLASHSVWFQVLLYVQGGWWSKTGSSALASQVSLGWICGSPISMTLVLWLVWFW